MSDSMLGTWVQMWLMHTSCPHGAYSIDREIIKTSKCIRFHIGASTKGSPVAVGAYNREYQAHLLLF